jgi:hypothetical protein
MVASQRSSSTLLSGNFKHMTLVFSKCCYKFTYRQSDWAIKDLTLLNMVSSNARINSCNLCNSTMHSSAFCPKLNQVNQQASLGNTRTINTREMDKYSTAASVLLSFDISTLTGVYTRGKSGFTDERSSHLRMVPLEVFCLGVLDFLFGHQESLGPRCIVWSVNNNNLDLTSIII